jgi:hypothetical protein
VTSPTGSYPMKVIANSPDRVIDNAALLHGHQNSFAENGSRLVRQGKAARCVDIGNRLPKKPATRWQKRTPMKTPARSPPIPTLRAMACQQAKNRLR